MCINAEDLKKVRITKFSLYADSVSANEKDRLSIKVFFFACCFPMQIRYV